MDLGCDAYFVLPCVLRASYGVEMPSDTPYAIRTTQHSTPPHVLQPHRRSSVAVLWVYFDPRQAPSDLSYAILFHLSSECPGVVDRPRVCDRPRVFVPGGVGSLVRYRAGRF